MTGPTGPDPADVQRTIKYLQGLTDPGFAEALADAIMDPDHPDAAIELAAFRSEDLAYRSYTATRFLIDNVNAQLRRRDDESNKAWALRAEHFRTRVGMERRLLQPLADAAYVRRTGRLPTAPNPRHRAMRELARRHSQEYLELVRAEERKDRERRQREKEERKAARKAAKQAAR